MRRGHGLAVAVATILAVLGLSAPAAYANGEFAPVDRPGPALTVPPDLLAASLTCTAGVTNATRAPVLLLPATGVNSREHFGWNYEVALTRAGIPWCASDVQGSKSANHNMEDIQVRGEYVTYAIRTMHAMAGRKISTLGHSQGGMIARWSLRFWPDTRAMVDDVIAIAPSHPGMAPLNLVCASPCQPAVWQQRLGTRFKAALDSSQETFAGISYTTIRTDYDEMVVPSSNSALGGPGNIANWRVQDRCPLHVVDHLGVGTYDAVAEAFVMDALRHPSPAQLSRISAAVCRRPLMSGVNPVTFPRDAAAASAAVADSFALAPRVAAEPPLKCYTLATGCP